MPKQGGGGEMRLPRPGKPGRSKLLSVTVFELQTAKKGKGAGKPAPLVCFWFLDDHAVRDYGLAMLVNGAAGFVIPG